MTGRPTDGIPWWGKIIYGAVMAPIVVLETINEMAQKVLFAKKKKRGKK
jgi:hypothetical protein